MEIRVVSNILKANEAIAAQNRACFEENGVFVVNVMGSPGAGKTSLLVRTIQRLRDRFKIGVIEGDIATSHDAELVGREGVEVVQINTDGACHLDANMVREALDGLDLKGIDILFIENVGGLVCPATFHLGEDLKVAVSSVPEGDDKPRKYLGIFRVVDGVVLNKMDLFDPKEFDLPSFRKDLFGINKGIRIFEISCKNGEGLLSWVNWLMERKGLRG